MKYARILAAFYGRAWALPEDLVLKMSDVLNQQAAGVKWSQEEISERIADSNAKSGYVSRLHEVARFLSFDQELEMEAAAKGGRTAPGSVALIPVVGIVSHRMSLMSEMSGPGGASIQNLTAQFRQALEDGNCKAIVLDVDSPGGSVSGVMELASEIFNARKQKPIKAVCNSMACSAAYWLASACDEVIVTPSGQAGSIGVYMMHQDESKALENDGIKITLIKAGKYKAEGNPTEPLSDDARAAFQAQVDDYYSMFVKAVAQNRGTTQAKVRDGYGQGRSLLAASAVKEDLADRIATLDQVLGEFGVKTFGSSPRASASASASAIAGKKPDDNDPDNDDDDDDDLCAGGCSCDACKACTGERSKAKSDDDMNCTCACEACKACENKGSAKSLVAQAITRRRRQLALM